MTTAPHRQPAPESEVEERLYRAIYDAIVERRLLPGARLPEQHLSDLFSTSRSRVRTVLSRLAQDRYVDLKPNRGAFIARPSPQEAREVFEARRILESHVVHSLAGQLSAADHAALGELLQREKQAQLARTHQEAIRLSGEYHLELARLAGNSVVLSILEGLIVRSSLIIAVYGGPTLDACAEDEHTRLLELLAASDPAAAERFLQEHLAHILASLDFKARPAAPPHLKDALLLGR